MSASNRTQIWAYTELDDNGELRWFTKEMEIWQLHILKMPYYGNMMTYWMELSDLYKRGKEVDVK